MVHLTTIQSPSTASLSYSKVTVEEVSMGKPTTVELNIGKRNKYKNTGKPPALASSGVEISYRSLGGPTYTCPNCKVMLPRFKDTPEPLKRLLDYTQPATSTFRDLIRIFNVMLCLTSFGARIDHSINKGRGLYTFRINGQNYHRIRSLLPTAGTQPRTAPRTYLLWIEEYYRCKVATDIDDIILAELPSPTIDPIGYKAVSDYMMRKPCGKDNRAATCNIEGKCSKHVPKPFYAETIIDQDGYPIYRSKAIKYLFKYLNKGSDRATIVIQENVQQDHGMADQKVTVVDEIKNYLNFRYLVPSSTRKNPNVRPDSETLYVARSRKKVEAMKAKKVWALSEFTDMPQPNPALLTSVDNRLIREARAFDIIKSMIQHQELYPQLNPEQRLIYEEAAGLLTAVGDGKVPARIKDEENEPTWIEIPETFLISSSDLLI
uniref:Uncharacterized protein n=1 Tax=Tanacetum cinerariifolium TaxID=118510 RepID=A0A6L2NZA2_TANCI|nr:hypothetical protein [Tanacetum cinerariifolium]